MTRGYRRVNTLRSVVTVYLIVLLSLAGLMAVPEAAAVSLASVRGKVNAPAGLSLRTGPSTRYRVITILPYGTPLTITGTTSDWFRVTAAGKSGYVNSWYVTLIGTPSVAISRGNVNRKMIALTFDCGSDLGNTYRILDILAEYNIKASFGLAGSWIKANPDAVRRIVQEGHQVINHTLNHPSYTGYSAGSGPISPAKRLSQLEANDALLRTVAGATAKPYWRPPFGDYDAGVLRDVGAAGWSRTILWTVDSMGWAGASPSEIKQRVIANAGNGVIVLMHVGAASRDVDALESLIQTLQGRGYQFGTVAQVIAP
jgi:peptidoglycan/xylan/chitin deacetylase (PgdA/CDA1 family)